MAKLGVAAAAEYAPAKPLYLRAPDARPQEVLLRVVGLQEHSPLLLPFQERSFVDVAGYQEFDATFTGGSGTVGLDCASAGSGAATPPSNGSLGKGSVPVVA